jgi:hypothetical protein
VYEFCLDTNLTFIGVMKDFKQIHLITLLVFNPTLNCISFYHVGQFYWWRHPSTQIKQQIKSSQYLLTNYITSNFTSECDCRVSNIWIHFEQLFRYLKAWIFNTRNAKINVDIKLCINSTKYSDYFSVDLLIIPPISKKETLKYM